MFVTPAAFILIGFIAAISVLTGTFVLQQGVARIGRKAH